MSKWGVLSLRVLDALEQVGPMTSSDMQAYLGLERPMGGSVMARLTKATPRQPKRAYVYDWRRDQDGQRSILRAVYAAGNKPCKKKPKAKSHADSAREYMQRCQRKAQCVEPGISQKRARALVARMCS